ncbi:hypothetical protein [Rahnella inusitata]|uniref:hypothetical protein n=1 Tax=Rahnella inusitata TaxID=58169 RepID=UPI001BC83832|nr:hypothetical protein [Rahnella inusitata]QUT14158.1 hypothetical protein I2123_15855 [Rahnella inusitata]
MTDKTDIAALMRDMRDLADRIVECQGENSDGEEITRLYDQSDTTFKAQNILLVLNALEAERQLRETADRSAAAERLLRKASDKAFNEQLDRAEAAEKERDDLKSAHGNMVSRCALLRQRTDLPVDRVPAYNALVKAQEEIAAMKAQLANPVVLPAGYSTRNGHPFHEGERNVMIPNKHGDWLSRFDVEHALRVAGFKVQCGETTQQKPVISKEKLCDWLEDNFDIDDSQRDAFAQCFAHHCNCIVKKENE